MHRVMDYIDQGKKAGASIVTGGDAPSDEGYFVNPTIMVDVKPDMSVVREEIFGPVVVAQRFDDLDEVASEANDTSYGLAASVWTRDVSAMHKMCAKLKAGTVWGNCHMMIDPALAVRRLQAVGPRPRAGAPGRRGLYGIEDGHYRALRHTSPPRGRGRAAKRRRRGGVGGNAVTSPLLHSPRKGRVSLGSLHGSDQVEGDRRARSRRSFVP